MRSVLVTGSSSGIGRACALELASAGYGVFAGVRSERDASALRAEPVPRLEPIELDVADPASIDRAMEHIAAEAGDGGLFALVNNAGISASGPVELLDPGELRQVLDVNLIGPMLLIQRCLPMLRRSRGRIVNIGSGEAFLATPSNSAYCMSKHALEALTDSLRMEVAPMGVRVVLVEPGGTETRILEKVEGRFRELRRSLPPEALSLYGPSMEARLAMPQKGRLQPPERVARAVRRALDARRPRARYFAGADVRGALLLGRFAPARVRDGILRRIFGFPHPGP